jgi:hypothetical protein
VGLTNLGSESETCVGSRVHLVGVSISFKKNFYRLPFTPPSLVRRIGPSDSILPPSRLPMDLRAEEKVNRGNKRVLSEIDVSEWEITCTETCPREGKRRCDTSKVTQLPIGKTPS